MEADRAGKDHLIHVAELAARNPNGTYDTRKGVLEVCESSAECDLTQPSDN